MSSGSNPPRKPNVASTLFKASSRFLHGQAAGAGAPKSMKRQRPSAVASVDRDVVSVESSTNISDAAADEQSAGAKSKKRFVGVRQRPSGRWVAEIKDTTQKIRLWLGTFDSAEEGAKAYDSAARALRGANTRTNFVPAIACEGTTVPASKAARLIRLRQMAAASKVAACEKEAAARNVADSISQKGAEHSFIEVESQVNDSPALVRQDLHESVSSLDAPPLPSSPAAPPPSACVDDHTPPTSPPKPRLIGRRQKVTPELACPKLEQEEYYDAPPFAAIHDHGTVDNGSPIKLENVELPSLPKLKPQQSSTSENLSNAINHSLIADSPQDSSSPPQISFPSLKSSFDSVQPSSVKADGDLQSGNMEASDHLKSLIHRERFLMQRSPPLESGFSAFTVDNFVPPIPFHTMEAPRLMFRSDHTIISGLVAFSHHQLNSSCATNRDHVSVYPSEKDEVICTGRSLRSCAMAPQITPDGSMSLDEENRVTTTEIENRCMEPRPASSVRCKEMDYTSSEILYRMETERKIDRFILREKESAEIVPEILWPDYVLMDETAMESGLLGLDLSCENSGVYTSAFDFSAEAIDRDSCTSVMLEHEHLSDDSEFLLRMQYVEQSSNSPAQYFPQECVLLTEEPLELDYSMSPHTSSLPGPPLSPQETHSLSISSSLLWRLDDASACWDGQSSGSTETADHKPSSTGDGGECTSQDHEALWSSMDLAPLCMVA